MNLSDVINELVEERGLEREVLSDIICDSILAAYEKRYPEVDIRVSYDKKSDEISVLTNKKVVSHVSDPDTEVGLRKAHSVDHGAMVGDEVCLPFDLPVGRIEILRAKQLIATKIREVEAAVIYKEFKEKEGQIVHGVVHKCEFNGVTVKIQDCLAFMPKALSIPGVRCIVGSHIRAILKDVLPESRNDSQLILDQSSPAFLRKLFELEVPEIFEGLIEIKDLVRIPGYKTKMVVRTNDKNIDPVGTCVGVGGARIKPILREIGSEKIDVVSMQDSLEDAVKVALKPAEVNKVLLLNGEARVWVDEDQRSLAIGKMGQNISLASRLAGVRISLSKSEGVGAADVFVSEKSDDPSGDSVDAADGSDEKSEKE